MDKTLTYFDYNATTPLKPTARTAMLAAMDSYGNPSSVHAAGRAARRLMEDARAAVASAVGAAPRQVIFTSGGTESNNLALNGLAHLPCFVSAVEHDCTRAARADATIIPVDSNGLVSPDQLDGMLSQLGKPALVSVMLANNETGVVQPIPQLAAIVHKYDGLLHVDAAQALGKMPVNMLLLGADLLTLSAHKVGGPKGAGALVVGDNIAIAAQLRGGGQELRRRAGTENLVGIAGFGGALENLLADTAAFQQRAAWRDAFEAQIQAAVPQAIIYGKSVARLPNTSCIGLPGMSAETQLMALDLAGFAVSSGAACSSGKVGPSHVLSAMGADDKAAREAIRVSSGWEITQEDYNRLATAWLAMAQRRAA